MIPDLVIERITELTLEADDFEKQARFFEVKGTPEQVNDLRLAAARSYGDFMALLGEWRA